MSDIPKNIAWLADAPLFIDANQINRFYDAVVKPEAETGTTTIEITESRANTIKGKLSLEAGLSVGDLIGKFMNLLPGLDIKAAGEVAAEQQNSNTEKNQVTLHPIKTPQRQLVQLSVHYLLNQPKRIYLVDDASEKEWRNPSSIAEVPRQLVFLDLPSQAQAHVMGLPETKLIPTAAEFEDGKIELIYNQLRGKDGSEPPPYLEEGNPDELRNARREYWNWFNTNFSAKKAMIAVEEASSNHQRIRWIDYRVPLTDEGDTLHLHISPAGEYDTGVFAYNFIKRGFKHGLRLIGTLKSEPDMNVLAIYDK